MGRITLEKPAPQGGTAINLSSSLPKLVMVPARVNVLAGSSSATFRIQTAATPFVTADTTSKVTAIGVAQNILTVSPLLGRLFITPSSLTGGVSASGLIVLHGKAKAGGEVIALKSDSASFTLPATVTVPQGMNQVTFTISSFAVASTTKATIIATLNGASTQASVSLLPTRTSIAVPPISR
jgi:hypothetical protein